MLCAYLRVSPAPRTGTPHTAQMGSRGCGVMVNIQGHPPAGIYDSCSRKAQHVEPLYSLLCDPHVTLSASLSLQKRRRRHQEVKGLARGHTMCGRPRTVTPELSRNRAPYSRRCLSLRISSCIAIPAGPPTGYHCPHPTVGSRGWRRHQLRIFGPGVSAYKTFRKLN